MHSVTNKNQYEISNEKEHCGNSQYKYQIVTLTVNTIQPRTKKTSKQRVMKPKCLHTGNVVIGLRRLFEKTGLTQNGGAGKLL